MKERIEVAGSVVAGSAMELTQEVSPEREGKKMSFAGIPAGQFSSRGDYVPSNHLPSELPHTRLRYALERSGSELRLANDGLTCSYCILGAPGSGKTMLLLDILGQVLNLHAGKRDAKFGGLILDPKASLIDRVEERMTARAKDLEVINTASLTQKQKTVNVIDCSLDPWELGRCLVLAAQGAGVAASEPFWFLAWSNLFGAALFLLNWFPGRKPVTLRQLIESVLLNASEEPFGKPARRILVEADKVEADLASQGDQIAPGLHRDANLAISTLRSFYREKYVATVEAFIQRAYGAFARSAYDCYSGDNQAQRSFYDDILEDGKVVLVSLSPSEPDVAKILCTLVKLLFQQTVMGRKERCHAGKLKNWTRPVLIACDEYSEVASEVPGQPSGDGHFFALARENGCMGLLATQSVNVLQNSSLRDAWKSVFSNFAAKIFMSANDNETVEEASKLAGEDDWQLLIRGFSRSRDGGSSSNTPELRERPSLPHSILTRVLKRKQAVVIGSLDGRLTTPAIYFMEAREVKEPNE